MSVDWSREEGYTTLFLDDGTPVCNVTMYNGRPLPTFENSFLDRMRVILDGLVARQDDIWIVGYMKSGTHWLWEVVNMFVNKSAEVDAKRSKLDSFLEMSTLESLESLVPPRILSTHLAPHELQPKALHANAKIICPFRNPRDTAVSLYHHLSSEKGGTNLSCGWDRFIREVWCSEKLMVYSEWLEYSASLWSMCKENPQTMCPVIYEEMVQDPIGTLRHIASFLNINATDENIAEIATATQFENMKSLKINSEKALETTFPTDYTMFRKGKIGDWRNHFTEEQLDNFNAHLSQQCELNGNAQDLMKRFQPYL